MLHRHALDVQLDGETAELLGASLEGDTIAVDIGDLITDARSGGRSLSHLVRLRAGTERLLPHWRLSMSRCRLRGCSWRRRCPPR